MAMDKTFNAAEAEARISRDWIEGGYFRAGANASRAETFSIVIPPPNVTGSLHMGHAFNNTLQDILVRWHRMRGFDTLWQPGTDHAGIATQMVVERAMAQDGTNQTRREMGRERFVERVWRQKRESGDTIIGQLKRLGASCDWDRTAFTMSGAPGAPAGEAGNFHDAVIKVFVEMYESGLIYRGKRLVNWDPRFETAISDLEVENIETPGHMWHFRYPLAGGETYTYTERGEDGEILFEEERDYIAIATTRPETMLGDGAVAVHPSDERYAPIVGKLCEIPVGPKEHRRLIPIVTDEYPDPDFGSGAVKITGAHDFNDYAVAKRANIPCYRLMDTRAAMRADGAPYAEEAGKARALREGAEMSEADIDAINLVPDAYRGLDRFEARKAVVADITAEGLAVMVPANDPRLGKAAATAAPSSPAPAASSSSSAAASSSSAATISRSSTDAASSSSGAASSSPAPAASASSATAASSSPADTASASSATAAPSAPAAAASSSPAPTVSPSSGATTSPSAAAAASASSATAAPSPRGTATPSAPGTTPGSPPPEDPRPTSGEDGPASAPPLAPEEGGEMRTEEQNLVPLVEAKPIMQPYGDRSKVVIEPMLTDQWFVDTARIVQPAIDAVRSGLVTIMPKGDEKVYFNWLENIEPWCISRQLWWGHQVPVWYTLDPDGDADWLPICAATEADAMAHLKLIHGEDADIRIVGTEAEALDILGAGLAAQRTRTEGRIRQPQSPQGIPAFRDPDVLDTWFSSGLWPLGTLGWPADTEELRKYFPTSVLVTGFDILFFWVARMMMMQTSVLPDDLPLEARIPFRNVYVHALVRDASGKKMSKSLGNVLDPLDLIDEYGADAVRFTLSSMAAMGRDLKLSTQRIAGYRNFGTKLWNAVRFAEMYDVDFRTKRDAGAENLPRNVKLTVNRWIIGETARVREEVDAALSAYRFDDASAALYRFVWNVVCDWYVEFSKPILQGEDTDSKAETQKVMGWVLTRCMTLLHPFMPFITEELWRVTGHDGMLAHGAWPEGLTSETVDSSSEKEIRWVIAFIESVRSARAQMNVPAGATIPVVAVEWDKDARQAFETNEKMIAALARIDGLTEGSAPKGSIAVTAQGCRFALPLDGVIDVTAEKARLEKSLAKLGKEIKGMEGRVNNPKFAASAPPEVVEETRANLAARQEEAAALQTALDSLAELG